MRSEHSKESLTFITPKADDEIEVSFYPGVTALVSSPGRDSSDLR